MGKNRKWALLSHLTRAVLRFTRRTTSILGCCGVGSNNHEIRRLRSFGNSLLGVHRSIMEDTVTSTHEEIQFKRAQLYRGKESGDEDGGAEEDIDERAEDFIARFRRRLLMERQVSLALRYKRGNSF
ncbi:uncharacterized protein LOC116189054 [Punica granatum]|uniref:Uncharacterized protein n=2 Tax=Punica granatum TaxID=22663 RepID=A0A218WWQ5_PUNGR|nr:uncharacterized protein LOC116189054 [Punica granatum]OWM77267.1 hypothetical protein CDL15_Pgr028904 [Punica granatum]PKI51852.1 hypothetical protein CRG98_027770 [Punica granatum]